MVDIVVTLAIVSSLLFIAVPMYNGNIRKNRRLDATLTLLNIEQQQELYRANHSAFGELSDVWNAKSTPEGYYDLSIKDVTSEGYTIVAAANGSQKSVKEGDVGCDPLVLTVNEVIVNRTPADCW